MKQVEEREDQKDTSNVAYAEHGSTKTTHTLVKQ
jgi:hypothetical protein